MSTARQEAIAAGLTPPLVHLNGTSRKALLDGYMAALNALQAAATALHATAPNGRDYYSLGPCMLGNAESEHIRRIRDLRQIIVQMQMLAEAVQE